MATLPSSGPLEPQRRPRQLLKTTQLPAGQGLALLLPCASKRHRLLLMLDQHIRVPRTWLAWLLQSLSGLQHNKTLQIEDTSLTQNL